ncbi:MAG: hypothetical protein ACJ72D_25675, partial [Marmoricola sp.]
MASGRRAGSVDPDDEPNSGDRSADDAGTDDVIDPLRIAFDGLEDIEPQAGTSAPAQGPAPDAAYDPLAVLSSSMDDEDAAPDAAAADAPANQRRGLFRRGRGRDAARPVDEDEPIAPPQIDEPNYFETAPTPDAVDEPAESAEPAADSPVTASGVDLPRVTTWADDLADDTFSMEPWATGEIPAVKDTQAPDPEEPAAVRKSRGRRRRGAASEPEPVSDVADLIANVTPDDGTEPPAHGSDPAWNLAVDGGDSPENFLSNYLDAPAPSAPAAPAPEPAVDEVSAEDQRLASERDEQVRLTAERQLAEETEAARLADVRRSADDAENQRIAAEQAEADRIAAEQAEAARIEQVRVEAEQRRIAAAARAAEKAERDRIAAEKAEAIRLEAERKAAEQAEQDRIEAERKAIEEKARAEAERLAAARAEALRKAAEKAEADRLAAEEAERQRLQAIREAAQRREAARLAALQAEEQRRAAEEAERARLERERLERARQEAIQREKERRAAIQAEAE